MEGKCPKDLAIYVCRLCGFSAKEQGTCSIFQSSWISGKLIFIGGSWLIKVWWNCISEKNIWVKQKQKLQLEVQVPLRIHGLFPKSWLVEQVKLKNTGLSTRPYRHVSKIKFRNLKCGQMDQIEYPMEQPDYNNNSRGIFTGSGIYGLKPNPFRPVRTSDRFVSQSGPWILGFRIFYSKKTFKRNKTEFILFKNSWKWNTCQESTIYFKCWVKGHRYRLDKRNDSLSNPV